MNWTVNLKPVISYWPIESILLKYILNFLIKNKTKQNLSFYCKDLSMKSVPKDWLCISSFLFSFSLRGHILPVIWSLSGNKDTSLNTVDISSCCTRCSFSHWVAGSLTKNCRNSRWMTVRESPPESKIIMIKTHTHTHTPHCRKHKEKPEIK